MRASVGCAARSRSWTSRSTTTCAASSQRLERSGARLYRTHGRYRTYAAAPWIMLRNADLRRLRLPYFLAVGGSTPVGCVGFVEAALELARAGGGGRAARALARRRRARLRRHRRGPRGRAAAGRPAHPGRGDRRERQDAGGRAVVAKLASRTLRRCCAGAGRRVPARTIAPADLDAETAWLGDGYGHRTPEAERTRAAAAQQEGLELDPVYTAKAMAGLLALRERGRFGDGPGALLADPRHDGLRRRRVTRSTAAARAPAGRVGARGAAAPGRAAQAWAAGSGIGGPGAGRALGHAGGGSGSGTGGGRGLRGSAAASARGSAAAWAPGSAGEMGSGTIAGPGDGGGAGRAGSRALRVSRARGTPRALPRTSRALPCRPRAIGRRGRAPASRSRSCSRLRRDVA